MKGTILKCMEGLVIKQLGAAKWKEALTHAGMPVTRAFRTLEDIPDGDAMALMKGIATATSLSMEQVMEAFGEHWSSIYAPTLYGAYFAQAKTARDLLLNLDKIHEVVTRTMKSARPPRFRYEWKGDKHLIMRYESARGLVQLMPGLIRGVGKYYKQSLKVSLTGNDIHVDFP
jgi:Haem-NO-binding